MACFGIWRGTRRNDINVFASQMEENLNIPDSPAARKAIPIATGVLDYFPDAICAVAECSRAGNEQHNPGKSLHWDRSKSQDESDAMIRHFLQRGTVDTDGIRHSVKVAWRALALLQKEIEAAAIVHHEPQFSDVAEPGPVVSVPLIRVIPLTLEEEPE